MKRIYLYILLILITLRCEGVYSVRSFGLDSFPIQMKLTSNLNVGKQRQNLGFRKSELWSFGDKVIANGDPYIKVVVSEM